MTQNILNNTDISWFFCAIDLLIVIYFVTSNVNYSLLFENASDNFVTESAQVMVEFDTITITIVDSGQFESGSLYTIWEFVSRIGTDTQFVVTGEERLSFQHDTTFSPLWDLYYDFPLAVGRTWGIDFILPVPEVLNKEPIHTLVQHFASSFHTRMNGGGFNVYWTQEDWLVPGVGIVKSRHWQFGFFPWKNRTWTLVDYHLVN